jgi:hypothetical protein
LAADFTAGLAGDFEATGFFAAGLALDFTGAFEAAGLAAGLGLALDLGATLAIAFLAGAFWAAVLFFLAVLTGEDPWEMGGALRCTPGRFTLSRESATVYFIKMHQKNQCFTQIL